MGCGFIKTSALTVFSTELILNIFTMTRVLIFEVVFYKYKAVQICTAESTFVRLDNLPDAAHFFPVIDPLQRCFQSYTALCTMGV